MFYHIRTFQRVINTSEFPIKVKCLEIDGVGIFVHYNKKKEINVHFIRSHVAFRELSYCIVEADNFEKAVKTFYNEWEAAKIGGENEESKALWIARDCHILELPSCKLLNRNKKGEFICGQERESGNGEFGMCILENCDAPFDCPIDDFHTAIFEKEETNTLPVKKIQIDGKTFLLVRTSDVLKSKDSKLKLTCK